jgi:pimeloyl-ACP methyl ester carboxylesterase
MSKKKIFHITGMMRCANNWQNPIAFLKKAMPDYDIIALENKGAGIFCKEKAPLSIKQNVQFLREQFESQKGDHNIILGFSLGGMMASLWAHEFPDEVHKVVLVNSSFAHLQPFYKRMRLRVLLPGLMTFITWGKMREHFMYHMICQNPANKDLLIKQWAHEQKERRLTHVNIFRQLWAGLIFSPRAYIRRHPTLVLASLQDQLAHYSCSENIRDFLRTDYALHPTAGHDLLNDDIPWVSQQLKDWLASHEI